MVEVPWRRRRVGGRFEDGVKGWSAGMRSGGG